jgi:hypothetical protein
MISLTVLVSLALVPFTLAQSTDGALQVKAIQAHFQQSQIVPSLLATFQPSALLTVNFAGLGNITPGQLLTKEQSAPTPTVTVTPANSTVTLTGNYTIAMVDADIVGSDLSKGVNRHWLVNGVTVTDNRISNATANTITAYAGPGPAAGSGPHRYVIILYTQPTAFTAPPGFTEPIGVTPFDVNKYATDSGLGAIVAATYMTVEDGTSTVSVPVTSSVVSSTLVAQNTGSTTKSGSKTGTGTGTNAPAPTGNSALSLQGLSPLVGVIAALSVIIAA